MPRPIRDHDSLTRFRALPLGGVPLLVFAAALTATTASGTVWTVGAGVECNFSDLQAAIDAAAVSNAAERVIEVAKDQTYANIHLEIADTSVRITGGFASCGGTRSGQTRLSGAGDPGSVVEVYAATGRPQVTLEHLELSGGRWGGGANGNGLEIKGPVDVTADDLFVYDNDGQPGGGVDVTGNDDGVPLLRLRNTTISSNKTSWGGAGLACREGAEVIGEGSNTIIWNTAGLPLNGGGLLATTGCHMALYGYHRIANNRAARGGGIRLTGEARLELLSDATGSVVLDNNWADWDAAGMYVSGTGTELVAVNVRVQNNDVLGDYGKGAALLLEAGATALIEGNPSSGCPSSGRCSVFTNNDALFSVIHVGSGAQAVMRRTWIQYHDEGERTVDVVDLRPSIYGSTSLSLESVVVHHNAATDLMRTWGAGDLAVENVTIADNSVTNVFRQTDYDQYEPATGTIDLAASIVWEQHGTALFAADNPAGVTADCNLVFDAATLPSGSDAEVAPPAFANPAAGDYHLTASSAALDFCAGPTDPSRLDVDGEERGVDTPSRPSRFPGAFIDAGADELDSAPPALFRDGFESGDRSAWS